MPKELGYATIASVYYSFVTIFFCTCNFAVRGFGEYKLLTGLNMKTLITTSFRNSTIETKIKETIDADPASSIMVIKIMIRVLLFLMLSHSGPWNVLCFQ